MSVKIKNSPKLTTSSGSPLQDAGLFSAASFFDVVESRNAAAHPPLQLSTKQRPAIVAFYGFRGGAGRTLSLAHAAVLLAKKGLSLAAVDLDLESPGLHTVLGLNAEPNAGALFLLREAFLATETSQNEIDASRHIVKVPDVDELWVVPAGSIDRSYLAAIEEINFSQWHIREGSHPIRLMVSAIERSVSRLDLVLLDCRTGLNPSAATAVFHAADIVVLCTTLSEQAWSGISVFLEALESARSRRRGYPVLLLNRGMVPPGESGEQLASEFATRFEALYARGISNEAALSEPLEDPAVAPWLLDSISYDADIAARGSVDPKRSGSFEKYRSLANGIYSIIGGEAQRPAPTVSFDRSKILSELKIPRSAAFAEELSVDSIDELFVKSARHERIADPHSSLIIGAKGAGKSLFWRWLLRQPVKERRFIPGHAPRRVSSENGPLTLSADAFKELERSTGMIKNGTHKAFWSLYGLARMSYAENLISHVVDDFVGQERKVIKCIVDAKDSTKLVAALKEALSRADIGTLAERVLDKAEGLLSVRKRPRITLVYDGLDDGFDVGNDADAMRDRYVTALLQLINDVRGRFGWISLKVLLREDIWASVSLQNRSHLDAGRIDLRWDEADLWQMALRLLRTSKTYEQVAKLPATDSTDVDELTRALEPLWGRYVGGNQTARSSNYVKNRMADGLGRFFPRTLVQMLETAVEAEKKKSDPDSSRVLRLRSIQDGIEAASKARVKDLETEYTVLAPYLRLFDREQPTGSREEFRNRLSRTYNSRLRRQGKANARRGVAAGALHAGAGGWMKVVELLETVGVLGTRDANRLQVALLYRPGLGIPSYGG